jgi:radial spoke head protein 9
MNIHDGIEELMKYISTSNGVCLNIEERYKLEIALNNLHVDVKSEEMWFWGKIIGIEKDYYIALAINFREHPLFPKKKFYFCNSTNFVFSEMPEVLEHHLKDMEKFNTYFIGNPEIILEKYESNNDKIEDFEESHDNEDIFKPKYRLKNLTEGDRLSYVVRSIDYDTNVVPEGAFKMLPINEMRRNDTFTGYIF